MGAADNFLEGVDVGPGGVTEMTATDDGFPAGSTVVGAPVTLVNATWNLNLAEALPSADTCRVLIDRAALLGVVTDLSDDVQAFIIENPAVRTHEQIRVGSTLADIEARYPVVVEKYGTGKIAYFVREDVVSHYDDVEPNRAMLFQLSEDDIVHRWVVGAYRYVAGTLTEGLCPTA